MAAHLPCYNLTMKMGQNIGSFYVRYDAICSISAVSVQCTVAVTDVGIASLVSAFVSFLRRCYSYLNEVLRSILPNRSIF